MSDIPNALIDPTTGEKVDALPLANPADQPHASANVITHSEQTPGSEVND